VKLVRYILISLQRRQKFRIVQELRAAKLKSLILLLDCKTRWNSTYLILSRAWELKDALNGFVTSWQDDVSSLSLELYEWKHIEYLLELLYDCYLHTRFVSEHNGVTVHQVRKSTCR
jgi:hypothetical protein